MEYFWVGIIVIAAGFLVWREITGSIKKGGCSSCPSAGCCSEEDKKSCNEESHKEP
jgi:hypothetical protein